MTISLRLLPVLAGALALMPLAVPGVVPPLSLAHLTLHNSQHDTRTNEMDTRKVTPASQQERTITSRHPLSDLDRIKERILAKMQLTEAPRFRQPLGNLPDVIREGLSQLISPQQPPSTQAPPTLEKASILLGLQREPCRGPMGALCLHFTLDDSTLLDVATTTLWFWKEKDHRKTTNIFLVNEVNSRGNRTLLADVSMSETMDGWVKVDLSAAVKRWVREETQEINLNIWCSTCTHHTLTSKVADHTPFIVIAATETNTHQRRSVERECSGEHDNRCCRQAINVTMEELGWDDWIVEPTEFTFYYCHGSCPAYPPPTGRTFNGTEYSKMKQGLMLRHKTVRKDQLEPCCSPTFDDPMYIIRVSGTGTYKADTLKDLVVSSCGCRD